jgi:phosphate transport system substrate-binding protein
MLASVRRNWDLSTRLILVGIAAVSLAGVAVAALSVTGAGATFPYPIYSKWFYEYHKLHPDVEINYKSLGSTAGIEQVTAGKVDFGASDGPMNDQQVLGFKQQRQCDVLHFPTVLGAVVPTYHLPGATTDLNFTPAALAGIFLGKITKWNDPEIAKANPKVNLPNHAITVVHRAEASGTTYIWTDYLSKVSPEWKQKVGVGQTVNWPVGQAEKGNEDVLGKINQTEYSIGYVELAYAIQNKVPYGLVQNTAGSFVRADLASVTAAAAGAANMPADFRVSITNAPGRDAYPISSFTWLLIPSKIPDPAKEKAVVDFLRWMLGPGQTFAAGLSYAQLPQQVVARELKAISKIQ